LQPIVEDVRHIRAATKANVLVLDCAQVLAGDAILADLFDDHIRSRISSGERRNASDENAFKFQTILG
jgi:hypothetical protein